jgi:tRNA-binding EMAP/Myf-like protein
MGRKLVTVRVIDQIQPHPNADRLEIAVFGGWKVIVQKGVYITGDLALYAEPDSFIPNAIEPKLTKEGSAPTQFKGIQGERLRTMKLRGVVSQGLVLPTSLLQREVTYSDVGQDVSEELGVIIYESEADHQSKSGLSGDTAGEFPTRLVPKSDQERCQNMVSRLFQYEPSPINVSPTAKQAMLERGLIIEKDGELFSKPQADRNRKFEVTLKMDGSSATFGWTSQKDYVCSRNFELKQEGEAVERNRFVKAFKDFGIKQALASLAMETLFIQCELMGPGIQGNQEKFTQDHVFIYDVIINGSRVTAAERYALIEKLYELGMSNERVKHVPVLHAAVTLDELNVTNVQELLALADGMSYNPTVAREGLVFKDVNDGSFSFKAISNKWLLKQS